MRLLALRAVALTAAAVGTPLFLGGLACWVVYDACERAAQPYLRTGR